MKLALVVGVVVLPSLSASAQEHLHLASAPAARRSIETESRIFEGIVLTATGAPDLLGTDDTDTDGWASLFGVPKERVLLDVQHALAGKQFGVPVDASAGELEVVLDARASLELVLVDGTQALADVATWIETSDGTPLSSHRATDPEGKVLYRPLGAGRFRIACRRADCWPAVAELELAAEEQRRLEVQMRLRADLRLAVVDREGIAVSGLALELHSSEFDQPVRAWVESGEVRAPNGLVTDATGRLSVEGLPRGAYTWSAGLDGEPATGAFELRAGSDDAIRVQLP